jgi:hypothetical protein
MDHGSGSRLASDGPAGKEMSRKATMSRMVLITGRGRFDAASEVEDQLDRSERNPVSLLQGTRAASGQP